MTKKIRLQFWNTQQDARKYKKQFKAHRKQINKQSKCFTKEIKTLEKKKTQILKMKNLIKDIRMNIGNGANQMVESVTDIKDTNLEITNIGEDGELSIKKHRRALWKLSDYSFFSGVYGSFSRREYSLDHKISLKKHKKIEILPSIFSGHSALKLKKKLL